MRKIQKKLSPPVWNTDGDLSTHIDTIMHLCFLGVTQTTGTVLKEVFLAFGQFTKFHEHEHQLKTIRGLRIDWCKCWVFGSTTSPFGPWVSENCLAYARIFKHMYILLDNIPNNKIKQFSKLLVQALVVLLSRIMQDTVNSKLIVSVNRHVKNIPHHPLSIGN